MTECRNFIPKKMKNIPKNTSEENNMWIKILWSWKFNFDIKVFQFSESGMFCGLTII